MATAKHPHGVRLDSVIATSPSSVLSDLDAKFHLFFTTTTRSVHHSHFVDQAYEAREDMKFLHGTQLASAETGRKPRLVCFSSLCL